MNKSIVKRLILNFIIMSIIGIFLILIFYVIYSKIYAKEHSLISYIFTSLILYKYIIPYIIALSIYFAFFKGSYIEGGINLSKTIAIPLATVLILILFYALYDYYLLDELAYKLKEHNINKDYRVFMQYEAELKNKDYEMAREELLKGNLDNSYKLARRALFYEGDNGNILLLLKSIQKEKNELYDIQNKDKIEIGSKNNPALFICFDILYYDKDITNEPLYKRKDKLSKINESDYLLKSKVFEDGEKLFKSIKRLDLEGIVCKDKFSTYQVNTRSNSWIKVKNYKVESFFIGGYTDGEKDRFSIYLGEKSNGKLRYVGKVFVSKKDKLYEKLKNRKSVNNPFLEFKENINFVNPIQEVKVKYIERNNNNHLREAFYMH